MINARKIHIFEACREIKQDLKSMHLIDIICIS